MRVRPDGARSHDDAAIEDTPRAPVENALVELAARGARRRMVDHGVGIDMLLPADDEEAVEGAGGRLAAEAHLGLVPHEAAVEGDGARAKAAAARLPHARPADLEGAAARALGRVALEDGVFAEIDVDRRIGQPRSIPAERHVALDERGAAARSEHDEASRMLDPPRGAGRDEEEMDRFRHDRARGDLEQRPVTPEGGIERGEAVLPRAPV